MKNREKYREQIIDIKYSETDFCEKFVEPNILAYYGKDCHCVACNQCTLLKSIWLNEEYKEPKEPKVDWSKVAVDTPILVCDSEAPESMWSKRHFSKYCDGKVYAFGDGCTSWSARPDCETCWRYAKLAETPK